MTRCLRFLLLVLAGLTAGRPALASDQWTPPTPEELSMTSVPEVPGAPAVILYKEQKSVDALRMWSYYVRLKVLTEGGKEYANVELPYMAGQLGWNVDSVAGRTIHPDGSITPYTGKPYDMMVQKIGDAKLKKKVFTLPAVEVGSILEYRYKLRYDDAYFASPMWVIQSDLFVRKAYYSWHPTSKNVIDPSDGGQLASVIAWTPLLPPGTAVRSKDVYGVHEIELDVHDIRPLPKEELAPPMQSVSYRVLFYYTPYQTTADYWKNMGKRWSKSQDRFIGPGGGVRSAVGSLVQPSDADDQKLRKIYAAVMAIENTDFTREHTSGEDKAQGLKEVSSTEDILTRRRGTGDELTELFVAMVRAAGMKAYVMGVANRDQRFFLPGYLSLGQFDDLIAVVPVGGKDMYFDPGQRYCSYGKLAWKHSLTGGLRQTDSGAEASSTPGEGYEEAKVTRVADLSLDDSGAAQGSVVVTYTGDPALYWRQAALRGDATSLHADLRSSLEQELPGGMEIQVKDVLNLTDSDKPLKVVYVVSGAIGSATGKRLLVPANLFEVNSKAKFNAPKRELAMDFHYASYVQDAVRLKLPETLVVESVPAAAKGQMPKAAMFNTFSKTSAGSITTFRNVMQGRVLFYVEEYPAVKKFFSELEQKDAETLVLARPGPGAMGAGSALPVKAGSGD